ncbi:MAG TPA: PadR family transcriptional regulator [Pseudonocardia sp.]
MNPAWDTQWAALRGPMRHRARMAAFAAQRERGDEHDDDQTPGDDRHHGRRGRRRGPRGTDARGFDPRAFGPGFPGGFGPGGFGPGGPPPGFGFGPRGGRRGRRSRGDIRLAVIALLAEQPRHGYEIIQEVAERTGGAWKPSPGSVYPTIQQLEDEGLVRTEETEGRRTVSLTDAGTQYVEQHGDELAKVWDVEADDVSDAVVDLRSQYGQLHAAVLQIMTAGTDAQREQAATALADARKAIYRLLAE